MTNDETMTATDGRKFYTEVQRGRFRILERDASNLRFYHEEVFPTLPGWNPKTTPPLTFFEELSERIERLEAQVAAGEALAEAAKRAASDFRITVEFIEARRPKIGWKTTIECANRDVEIFDKALAAWDEAKEKSNGHT